MSNRFGRNQKRKLTAMVLHAQQAALHAQGLASLAHDRLDRALRDQLEKGTVPLEVEHFLSPEQRSVVMHAIFDERRANLHYQHELSPHDLKIQRDKEERERFGQYLGRAIADRLADAYAGRDKGTSRTPSPPQLRAVR
jgi:hypothetical protein